MENRSIESLLTTIHSSAPEETADILQSYLELTKRKLGAISVSWLVAYRGRFGKENWSVELMDGWKVMDLIFPSLRDIPEDVIKAQYLELAAAKGGVDPMTQKAIEHAGKSRVHRLSHILHKHEDTSHWILDEFLSENNISDRMLGVFHLDAEVESYTIVDRSSNQPSFSYEDEAMLTEMITICSRLHYWLVLERGLAGFCQRPLSPRQCELLNYVLKSLSEKEIAEHMNLTKTTVHSYLMDIYKIFSVNSRAELISKWLLNFNSNI